MRLIWSKALRPAALRGLAWTRIAAAVALSIIATLITIWLFGILGGPQTLAVIEAESEYVRYRVFNSQLASFPADGFRVGYADEARIEGTCLSGMVEPRIDGSVEYIRQGSDPLLIVLEKGGSNETTGTFNGMTSLVADSECGEIGKFLFPVWGPGQVGDTFSVRSEGMAPLLNSGTVVVLGRTIDLGWLGEGGAIYSTSSQPLTIPPGGWIWTGEGDEALPPEEAALFGYADASPEKGLGVRVTTESPLLKMIAPGGTLEPMRIEIGLFAQALNDPNILRAQFALLIFLLVFPIMIDAVALATSRTENND
jgi:hypothetical protein